MKSIIFPIYFPNGNFIHVTIESYSRVGDVKAQLMKKVKLHKSKIPFFCLYEVCYRQNKIGKIDK